jgi:zinc protease
MQLLRDELRNYAATFTQGDVDVTKNQIIKSNTRAFESLADKLSMLRQMSLLGLPSDFVERNQEALLAMTRGDFRTLIETYLDESQMIYVVVGDAATQRERLSALGYGQPVLLDIHGRPVH